MNRCSSSARSRTPATADPDGDPAFTLIVAVPLASAVTSPAMSAVAMDAAVVAAPGSATGLAANLVWTVRGQEQGGFRNSPKPSVMLCGARVARAAWSRIDPEAADVLCWSRLRFSGRCRAGFAS